MKENPFDGEVSALVEAMKAERERLRSFSEGTQPYRSVKLSEVEETLAYDFPETMFPEEMLTRGEAAARLLESMGPVEYVQWVERMEKRRVR